MNYNERLRHTLKCAEERFGPRVYADELPSITFHDGPPHLAFLTVTRMIIRLSQQCQHDYLLGCYQLAHETVHLLSPGSGYITTTLEEGIAVVFARDYISATFGLKPPRGDDERYDQAAALVRRLLAGRADAIVRLRRKEPVISRITQELLETTYPGIAPSLSVLLVTPFFTLAPPKHRKSGKHETE